MTDSALKVLEQTLLLGHVPGPTGACRWRVKADRSFARHAASEKQSQTRTRQRTPQHYECVKRTAYGFRHGNLYRIRSTSLRRETQLDAARHPHSDLKRGEPNILGKQNIVFSARSGRNLCGS